MRALFIGIAVAIVALALFSSIYTTYFQPIYPPINISRADYNAASAKWKAQHIVNYELVVAIPWSRGCLGCGTYDLHVHSSKVDLISYASPVAGYGKGTADDAAYHTVDALFSEVDRQLSDPEAKCDYYPVTVYWSYSVRFNQQYGYPEYIERIGRGTDGQSPGSLECGAGTWSKVTSFKPEP